MKPCTSQSQFIKGTCLIMCPSEEIRLRQRENMYHILECRLGSNGQHLPFPDHRLMVKEFSRSAADRSIHPSAVRPMSVLRKTVIYLISQVCTAEDVSWRQIYDFVSDRFRAVVQDVTVQGGGGREAIPVLLPIARFYVYALYRLSEHNVSEFDPMLNLTQLNGVLLTMLNIFKEDGYKLNYSIVDYGKESKHLSEPQPEGMSQDSHEDSALSSPPHSSQESAVTDCSSENSLSLDLDRLSILESESSKRIPPNGEIMENVVLKYGINDSIYNDGCCGSNKIDTSDTTSCISNSKVIQTCANSSTSIQYEAVLSTASQANTNLGTSSKIKQNDAYTNIRPCNFENNDHFEASPCSDNATNSETNIYLDSSTLKSKLINTDSSKRREKLGISSDECSEMGFQQENEFSLTRYSVLEEVVATYLLLHFGNPDALYMVLEMSQAVRKSVLVSAVFRSSVNWIIGNHIPFVKLLKLLTPVLALIAHFNLNKIQRFALGVMSVSHNGRLSEYKSSDLGRHLLFPSPESALKTCQYYGLSTSDDGVAFAKGSFKWNLDPAHCQKSELVDEKLKHFKMSQILLS